jgi:S1-C subfamily serine protease
MIPTRHSVFFNFTVYRVTNFIELTELLGHLVLACEMLARSLSARSLLSEKKSWRISTHASSLGDINIAITRRQCASLLASIPLPLILTSAAPDEAVAAPATADFAPTIAPAGPLTPREQLITDIFARSNPAVVTIFDATVPGRAQSGPAAIEQPEGNGSGFVYDTQGHIVTNYHVLGNVLSGASGKLGNNAKIATVYLLNADGVQQAFDGYLVGADKARDLVVLKINANTALLHPISLGNASSLKIGQSVMAIGAPFGFEHSLSVGVVSALGRGFQSQTGSIIGGGIQTDAAINPGNSGGPLLDLQGNIVGINTAIFTNTSTSVGVGFALPAETAAKVVPQLIAYGKVTRASLGLAPAADPTARALRVSDGVLIQSIESNSPAAAAGLMATRRGFGGIVAGDVIVRIGQRRVRSTFDLSAILDAEEVGNTVEVEVLRGIEQGQENAQKVVVTATLAAE